MCAADRRPSTIRKHMEECIKEAASLNTIFDQTDKYQILANVTFLHGIFVQFNIQYMHMSV